MELTDDSVVGVRTSQLAERRGERALILSLVHPDFLAPIYSISQVLRDKGFEVHVFSFSSPAGPKQSAGEAFTMHDCGRHVGNALERWTKRRDYATLVTNWAAEYRPSVIFASCPFTYLLARRFGSRATPLVYLAFEVYAATLNGLLRSPATTVRNWRARRTLNDAAVVCAPSQERAEWLVRNSRLSAPPVVLLNAPYGDGSSTADLHDSGVREKLLPSELRSKRIILHTGNVSATQGVLELVESVHSWRDDAALVITKVGSDPYGQAVRAAAQNSSKRDNIVLLPMLSRDDMLALQSVADIGVCFLRAGANLSASLPAPNKIGEYLHAGLFILGTKSAYNEELERRGVACSAASLEPSAISGAVSVALQRAAAPETIKKIHEAVATWYRMEVQLAPVLNTLESRFGLRIPSSSTHSFQRARREN